MTDCCFLLSCGDTTSREDVKELAIVEKDVVTDSEDDAGDDSSAEKEHPPRAGGAGDESGTDW